MSNTSPEVTVDGRSMVKSPAKFPLGTCGTGMYVTPRVVTHWIVLVSALLRRRLE